MKQRAELEILSVFVNFSGQNFVKVADGSGILQRFQPELRPEFQSQKQPAPPNDIL